MWFLLVLFFIALMFTNLGKISMLKLLQGFVTIVASLIGTFGIFIFAAMIYYWKVNA